MKTRLAPFVATALLPLLSALPQAARGDDTVTRSSALTEDERIIHVLHRFALGPTPGLVDEVRKKGIEAWFEELLAGKGAEDPALLRRLEALKSLPMTNREISDEYYKPLPPNATIEQIRERNQTRAIPRRELKDAVLLRAVYGANPVREVASDFFRNHFCVSVDKVDMFATEYEREVVRAEAFGNFGRMLEKSAKSPAMLVYLDNVLSRRPLSKAELSAIEISARNRYRSREAGEDALDAAKQRGLNENYGRELLELHTLGVDQFYRQQDVVNVAKALTGWTIARGPKDAPIEFAFRKELHQDGNKVFLGSVISENKKDPAAEGMEVLEILKAHKGTAQFLAWKLCRWLVDDDPPQAMVDRVAAEFSKTKGDLTSVYRAILKDPEFFAHTHFRAKFKRPFEFVVSALRITGATVERTGPLHAALQAMNEPIYQCGDPTGFYDQAEAWRDPGAIAVRWQFAVRLAAGRIDGVRVSDALYAGLEPARRNEWKGILVKRIFPTGISSRTSLLLDDVIAAALEKNSIPQPMELAPVIVGALLGSAEFQKQ